MENFKEWLNTQEMAFGNVARAAGRFATDLAFGPETGVSGDQAVDTMGQTATAANMAVYALKRKWHQKMCQRGNIQSCMTACKDYDDQVSCNTMMSAKNRY